MSKEIVYQRERKIEVIEHDTYHGHEYYIVNYGTHPCAYVESKMLIKGDYGYDDEKLNSVDVHGGFTYYDIPRHFEKEQTKYFLGWDYSHCNDFAGYDIGVYDDQGKKWTYEEILEEVHSVIEQLEEIEKNAKFYDLKSAVKPLLEYIKYYYDMRTKIIVDTDGATVCRDELGIKIN